MVCGSESERGTPIYRHPTRDDRGRRTAFTRPHPDRREPPSGAIAAVARCGDPERGAGQLVGAGGCRQSHAVPEEKTPAAAALSPSVLCEHGLGFAILVVVSVLGRGRRRSMRAVTGQAEPIMRYPITQ
jgi:hypothetical protein